MNSYRKVKLCEVADIKLSNVDKKTKHNEREIKLCNYTDVYNNSFISKKMSNDLMIASCNDNEYKKFILRKGQVAVTKDSEKTNDIGIPTYILENFSNVVLGYHLALFTPNSEKLDGIFLYYWLNTKQAKQYFENNAGGSGQRCSLPLDILKEVPLSIPSVQYQKEVSQILFNLDTKIELNNLINNELEQMAKTLYDYWFVQFDFPNEQGKPYKSSGGKMVYDEELKREIPEGWEVKSLSDIADITMGQSPAGSSYNDNGIGTIFFQGSTDFGWRYPTIRQYTTAPSRFAKAGDILLSVRAPVGTINIADNNCCIGRGLAALNSKDGFTSYLFYVMEYFKRVFDYRNSAGTTFGAMTKDDLYSLKVIKPKSKLLEKYDKIVSNYNKMILVNHKQNQELASLRDWLLPMLMNGQVTLKDAEEKMDMAAEPESKYYTK